MMKLGFVKMVNTGVVYGATVIAAIAGFIPTQHHIVRQPLLRRVYS